MYLKTTLSTQMRAGDQDLYAFTTFSLYVYTAMNVNTTLRFFGHFTSRNDCNILPTIIHKQIDEPIGQYSHKKMGRIRSLFDLFLSNVWIEIGPIFMGSPGIWSICLWRT